MIKQLIDTLFNDIDPSTILYITPGGDVSVGDLRNLCLARSSILQQNGVLPGQKVLLSVEDEIKWAATFWALVSIGAHVVILPSFISKEKISELISQHKISSVCTDRADLMCLSTSIHDLTQPVESRTLQKSFYQYSDSETVLSWPSSGTNGAFKLIDHNTSSLLGSSQGLDSYMKKSNISPGDIILCGAKVSFSLGWLVNVFGCLYMKTVAVVSFPPSIFKNFDSFLDQHNVDHVFLTPYVLALVSKSMKDSPKRVKSWTSGAEPLSRHLINDLKQKFKINLTNTYGLSETFLTTLGAVTDDERIIGTPTNGIEYRIVDDQGNTVKAGTSGILQIKAPGQFMSYLDDPISTQQVIRQGWVHTNDIVRVNDNGDLIFLGRANSCIKIKGIWVSMLDIEEYIIGMDHIQDCVVVKSMDSSGLDSLTALVVVDCDDYDWPSRIRDHLRNILKKNHMIPSDIKVVDAIPRTGNLKKIRNLDTIIKMLGTHS